MSFVAHRRYTFRHNNTNQGEDIMDMKLEFVVLPVTDVDRAKAFYEDGRLPRWTSTTAPARSSASCS